MFVDANEFFPLSVMDLGPALAEDVWIDFVWTVELLDLWERVIVGEGKRTPETAAFSVGGGYISGSSNENITIYTESGTTIYNESGYDKRVRIGV